MQSARRLASWLVQAGHRESRAARTNRSHDVDDHHDHVDKPLERTTDNDDTPKMFHYVRKSKIAESAVMGNFVVALCGETFPVTRSPKPGSPVCPDCKKIYESMRKA